MDNLENTYQWLLQGNEPFSQAALERLVQQMRNLARRKQEAETLALMEEARYVAEQVGDALTQARLRLECARTAYQLKKQDEAMLEVQAALRLLAGRAGRESTYKHYAAVAQWMLGNLLLEMPGKRHMALAAWQSSLSAFEILAAWTATEDGDPHWYQDRCAEMRQGLERAIRQGYARLPQPTPQPAPRFKWPISSLYSGNLRSIPVVGEIPAGGFGPSGIDHYQLDVLKLEPCLDEFILAGKPHRLVNLRGSPGVTQLVSSKTYFILQVSGDSMNRALIDKGDYVLLCQQESADHHDIVAAEIVNVDTQATLKLFVRSHDAIELQPRSTNPRHRPYRFEPTSEGFYIRGVVLGVFKRV